MNENKPKYESRVVKVVDEKTNQKINIHQEFNDDGSISEEYYYHPLTHSHCESIDEYFSGWREQDEESNSGWNRIVDAIKNNEVCREYIYDGDDYTIYKPVEVEVIDKKTNNKIRVRQEFDNNGTTITQLYYHPLTGQICKNIDRCFSNWSDNKESDAGWTRIIDAIENNKKCQKHINDGDNYRIKIVDRNTPMDQIETAEEMAEYILQQNYIDFDNQEEIDSSIANFCETRFSYNNVEISESDVGYLLMQKLQNI